MLGQLCGLGPATPQSMRTTLCYGLCSNMLVRCKYLRALLCPRRDCSPRACAELDGSNKTDLVPAMCVPSDARDAVAASAASFSPLYS